MILGPEGPLWFILIRQGDPSAYLPSLKTGYDTPESALRAWQDYANLNWPNVIGHTRRGRKSEIKLERYPPSYVPACSASSFCDLDEP
jgi:hypothetical protein